jgi:hypothetical protein
VREERAELIAHLLLLIGEGGKEGCALAARGTDAYVTDERIAATTKAGNFSHLSS